MESWSCPTQVAHLSLHSRLLRSAKRGHAAARNADPERDAAGQLLSCRYYNRRVILLDSVLIQLDAWRDGYAQPKPRFREPIATRQSQPVTTGTGHGARLGSVSRILSTTLQPDCSVLWHPELYRARPAPCTPPTATSARHQPSPSPQPNTSLPATDRLAARTSRQEPDSARDPAHPYAPTSPRP